MTMMTRMNKYLLRSHILFAQRVADLKEQVKKLRKKLPDKEYAEHPLIKFAFRIRKASEKIIPENPDHPEYRLQGNLRKYRRYKQGLKRYRLFFCFSSQPRIILYLYLNDEKSLRKEGDKSDPYQKFTKFVNRGRVSHDPEDPRIQEWVRNYGADG